MQKVLVAGGAGARVGLPAVVDDRLQRVVGRVVAGRVGRDLRVGLDGGELRFTILSKFRYHHRLVMRFGPFICCAYHSTNGA